MRESTSAQNRRERQIRIDLGLNRLSFGIKYLDDCLRGIFHDDLVLVGARSGSGKTQLCTIIAEANLRAAKRVDFFALESGDCEITQRIKYRIFAKHFYADHDRPRGIKLNFADWMLNAYDLTLEKYEALAFDEVEEKLANLVIHSRGEAFTVDHLSEQVELIADKTDLVIIDHAHYFDFETDNENRALKEIAKTVRHLSLDMRKPIVLVGHLRKADKFATDLAPGMEEFHGSSDLFKIATKIVTVGKGKAVVDGKYETFFRTPKARIDGTAETFLGRCFFDPRVSGYEPRYAVGRATLSRDDDFEDLQGNDRPDWAIAATPTVSHDVRNTPARKPIPNFAPIRNVYNPSADA